MSSTRKRLDIWDVVGSCLFINKNKNCFPLSKSIRDQHKSLVYSPHSPNESLLGVHKKFGHRPGSAHQVILLGSEGCTVPVLFVLPTSVNVTLAGRKYIH